MEELLESITPYLIMMGQILLSATLGFIIGWDRYAKSKPAGIKTYMYVCISTCLITLISIYSVTQFAEMADNVMMDPMRLAAQIVSGLGFLGAGVILKDGLNVTGLTSAAMIFFVGGVGIGIATGFYAITLMAVATSVIFSRVGNIIEEKVDGRST
ncbi:MgtC/SapB family protein [Paenalkalicoccus suaedae]|uniref:MgtC/SapB family protein n=1 Tax=Paenalkalicoccus suaedae TaxID=2592382 RepID=A0A859FHV1_9BACI|nr:MgtC/SapB family protein [Paenalkalicoccus suaedae]QKS72418.1 MgtC/SapB family protein [Paenalkalicoccus suaedae]